MSNFWVRTLSGAVILAFMLGGLLFSKYLFAILMLVILILGMSEFLNMNIKGNGGMKALSIISGALFFILLFAIKAYGISSSWLCAMALPLLAMMISIVLDTSGEKITSFNSLFSALIYVALPVSLSNLVVFDGNGQFNGLMMLCMFALVWASDIGAYCVGCTLGKYTGRLLERVSPKKSWAGFWGGLVCCMAISLIFMPIFSFAWHHCFALGVVVYVSGVFGDLFESVWKRSAGIKDSGKIIPGHGGILDRIDSALFALPCGYAYLTLFKLL